MTVPQQQLDHRRRDWDGRSDALRYALDHPAVGGVTAIGRKPTAVTPQFAGKLT
jgi:hypothetical protein